MDFSIFLRFLSSLAFNICGSKRFFFFNGSANMGKDERKSNGPPHVDIFLDPANTLGCMATDESNLNITVAIFTFGLKDKADYEEVYNS